MSTKIAESLAAAIKERGITQADIAGELNVSPAWVNQRLTGVRGLVEDLQAIADKAGLAPAWRDAQPVNEADNDHWYESSLLSTAGQPCDGALSAGGAQS